MFADFLPTAGDAIVNQLPKYRFMSGGQCTVPVTVRVIGGGDRPLRDAALARPARAGSCTCPACASSTARSPGSRLQPAARGHPRRRTRSLFFEHKGLYARKGPVQPRRDRARSARPVVLRAGSDVTIVATLLMVERALQAAEALAAEGIDAEVIDLRWIRPLDLRDRPGIGREDRPAGRRRGAGPRRAAGARRSSAS